MSSQSQIPQPSQVKNILQSYNTPREVIDVSDKLQKFITPDFIFNQENKVLIAKKNKSNQKRFENMCKGLNATGFGYKEMRPEKINYICMYNGYLMMKEVNNTKDLTYLVFDTMINSLYQ